MKKEIRDTIATIKLFIIGGLILAFFYYFFLFFAYDMDIDFLDIRSCDKKGGVWNAKLQKCEISIYK